MSSVQNTVETVNAAATAIVTAESRVQPYTVQKKRWGSLWSLYCCFGSHKNSKRIGHAVILSEPTSQRIIAPVSENSNRPATIMLPFIAPPSSPAYFLQSDPSSATQSPVGVLSVHTYSPGGTAPIFTIGPYAHETGLVSPPVFSTFTTEPSTASFTPPPESVQMTTPSSPEVPFAQLLSSSLARNKRFSGMNLKYPLSQYEYIPYPYPGSPGGHVKSPGSAISNSGTSSPLPGKRATLEFRMGEAPKFIGYDHFSNRKWGSRFGSGSVTPNGWGSRLGSGTLTPNSGVSRLGSGTLTPNGGEPPSRDSNLLQIQISEVVSLSNSERGSQNDGTIDHRVSFELNGEDIPTCIVKEPVPNSGIITSRIPPEAISSTKIESSSMAIDMEGDGCHQKNRTISLGSSKDFNFNNAKEQVSEKSIIDCEWWTNDKAVKKESSPQNNWTFLPMMQSRAS
ncbi:uncharacterized protein LOC142548681 [Primulina tabacum]|uniref:uncharacterized protein LOC142548681 n=1 Tax=Primulina tabacum TaxID=48773 RepID=UPI003F590EAA